jgi:hypothetical protein
MAGRARSIRHEQLKTDERDQLHECIVKLATAQEHHGLFFIPMPVKKIAAIVGMSESYVKMVLRKDISRLKFRNAEEIVAEQNEPK